MTTAKVTIFASLVALALGGTSYLPTAPVYHGGSGHHGSVGLHGGAGHHNTYANAKPQYSFGYGVNDDYSGNKFGHKESRDGYKTEGKYYVNLPDGRIQTVKYYADETGYHPEVSYEGVAHYDSHPPTYHNSAPVHVSGYH